MTEPRWHSFEKSHPSWTIPVWVAPGPPREGVQFRWLAVMRDGEWFHFSDGSKLEWRPVRWRYLSDVERAQQDLVDQKVIIDTFNRVGVRDDPLNLRGDTPFK